MTYSTNSTFNPTTDIIAIVKDTTVPMFAKSILNSLLWSCDSSVLFSLRGIIMSQQKLVREQHGIESFDAYINHVREQQASGKFTADTGLVSQLDESKALYMFANNIWDELNSVHESLSSVGNAAQHAPERRTLAEHEYQSLEYFKSLPDNEVGKIELLAQSLASDPEDQTQVQEIKTQLKAKAKSELDEEFARREAMAPVVIAFAEDVVAEAEKTGDTIEFDELPNQHQERLIESAKRAIKGATQRAIKWKSIDLQDYAIILNDSKRMLAALGG